MKEKYADITFKILLFIALLISLFFIDSWVLPQKTINDEIISYGEIYIRSKQKYTNSESKVFVGYIFLTRKNYEFSIQKTFIEENKITIKQSYIFKNITAVKSQSKDYSDKLMSGFNGACLYIVTALMISSIISLLMLRFNKNLSENGFQNIILFNSFLILCTLYILFLHN